MRNSSEVIQYLNKLREEQHVSISELARRVNMSKSTVSLYFNGTRQFPVNRLGEFAKALHTTPEKVLNVEDNKNGLSVDEAINSLNSYQGKPISDDQKAIIKDLIKGYLDRSNKNE